MEAADAGSRINLWDGSIRTGKSVTSVWAWVRHIVNGPKGDLLMIGWTIGTLRRNIIEPYLEPLLPVQYHMTADVPHIIVGKRKIYVAGASDLRAEARIRGMTLAGVYGDEVTVWTEGMFEQSLGRMSVPGSKAFFTTNPDSPNHWLKVKYMDRAEQGELPYFKRYHFTLEDNPHLDEEAKAMYRSLYTGLWRRRFILGEWAVAEGAVFAETWDPDRLVYSGPRWGELTRDEKRMGYEDSSETWDHTLGIDVGFTHPTAGILVGVKHRIIVPGEFRASGITDAAASESLREWLPIPRDTLRATVYDKAAPSFGEQLWRDGWPSTTRSDSRDVKARIRRIDSLFATGMLMIHESCASLIEELPGYRWDPKAQERGEDKPIKEKDDSIDALGYALNASEMTWGPLARTWEEHPELIEPDFFDRAARARAEGRIREGGPHVYKWN